MELFGFENLGVGSKKIIKREIKAKERGILEGTRANKAHIGIYKISFLIQIYYGN